MSKRRGAVPRLHPSKSTTRQHERFHPGHRPGHDLEPRDRLRRRDEDRRRRPEGIRRSTIPHPAGSSTIRRRSGKACRRPAARRSQTAEARRPPTSRRSASPTSARPWSSGTRRPASRSTTPSSGRTGAPSALCQKLKKQGLEKKFSQKTGLLLDPYFSGTKIAWLLDNVKGARKRAERGELLAGTIDSFLIWRLTGGQAACDRRDQRLAHAGLQHRHATNGTTSCSTILRIPRRAAAGGEGLRRRFRRHRSNRCSARRSRSSASPATSRRRRSARPASSRA